MCVIPSIHICFLDKYILVEKARENKENSICYPKNLYIYYFSENCARNCPLTSLPKILVIYRNSAFWELNCVRLHKNTI